MSGMMSMLLSVTLTTTSVLALIYIVLSARVIQGRLKYRVSLGHGGNDDLENRVRSHANFSEYVPLLLILMGLLELGGANKTALAYGGALLVVCRILHPIGIPRRVPNAFRFIGTVGTFSLLIAGSVYGLVLTLG